MVIATRKECIQAARQYVRRLGRAQRSLGVMARQMKDLQRELDRMDGLGSSGDMRGGGHARERAAVQSSLCLNGRSGLSGSLLP